MRFYCFKSVLLILIGFIFNQAGVAQNDVMRNMQTSRAGFNYSIESFEISKASDGKDELKIHVTLAVEDESKKNINMSYNLLVFKNGREIKKFEQSVRKENAYTCSVKCAGACPSILGTGKCIDCKCNYSSFLSAEPGKLRKGDKFEAKIVPARRGADDNNPKDNFKNFSYGGTPGR